MNAQLLRKLLNHLPDRGAALSREMDPLGANVSSAEIAGGGLVTSRWSAEADVWVDCYRNPRFPWLFIRHLIRHKLPFPADLPVNAETILLRKAYNMERGLHLDHDILQALALCSPKMTWERGVVQGTLLVRGMDTKKALERVGIPVALALTYERLFFNVLDRGEDTLYILPQVYPDGRHSEFFDGAVVREDVGRLLKRAGFRNGLDDLLWMIGHKDSDDFYNANLKNGDIPRLLEAMTMTNGYLLARNGFAFQSGSSMPAVSAARGMINAAKQGGAQAQEDAAPALDQVGRLMMTEMKAFAGTFMERRDALIRARNEAEAEGASAA